MNHHSSGRCTLITGGAGFIGSHLARRLLCDGESVVVLDDLSTGSVERLGECQAHPRLSIHIGSAADAGLVRSLVERCDRVFHLAATLGVRRVIEQPLACFENNHHTTAVVLAQAAAFQRPVLFASSSEVYGNSTKLPFRESDGCGAGDTSRPRWIYAGGKAMGEALAFAHQQESGLPVVVVRLFNTVGPGQSARYGSVLPTFAGQAVRDEPLTVHGSGQQTRCFSHVADVVEAMLRLMDAPEARGQIVNVGGSHEVTILDLAHQVRSVAKSSSPIVHVPFEKAFPLGVEDPPRRVPDLARLERLAGFRAMIPLTRIIEEVVAELRGAD